MRFVTLNLWGDQGPAEARMALLLRDLPGLRADVIALQEVREVPGRLRNQAEVLAGALGYSYVFEPAVSWGGGVEGLAILSRGRVREHRRLELPHATLDERRLLLSAFVEAGPGGDPVWVHTTHLNYRLTHGKQREDQVLAIDDAIARFTPDNPQVILGDFNARPDADEIRWLCGLTTVAGRRTYYQDAWALVHPNDPGWTWAARNPFTAALDFLHRDRRLDYIFVTPHRRDGRGRIQGSAVVLDQPDAAGVYPSDHFGLMADVDVAPIVTQPR